MDMEIGARAREGVLQREEEENDVQKLLRAWRNERHAPDILPAQEGLLTGLLDHLRVQVRFGRVVIGGGRVKC